YFGGGDVGADVLLQDGRRLWLFGDTVRDPGPQPRYIRNSMLVFGSECIVVVRPPSGRAVIPDRADGVGYWPMSVGRSEQDGYDLVAVGVQRVRTVGDGVWDFEVLGPSVAVFVVPRGGTPQLMQVHDLGPDHADVTQPMWGAASHVDGGWLYVYGTATTGEPMVFGHSLRVARVRLHEVTDQGRWAYWDGDAWSPDPDDAVELIPAVGGTSQTLSVWQSGDTWYALSKRDEFLGSHVVVWTAPSPSGPFTAHDPVAELPSDLQRGLLRYMPLAHPDLLPRVGTVVVSYSNNRANPDEVTADPLRYRPRFLRVRLPATH
ncbi:MAG: DUF4185 domain-containing protein, partial [Nocardioides sp.]|nr:DUF4185 domain-containing protein [Nocardioides sp.]